jgi:hypothetical protein
MNWKNYTRREFVKQNSLAGLGATIAVGLTPAFVANCATNTGEDPF